MRLRNRRTRPSRLLSTPRSSHVPRPALTGLLIVAALAGCSGPDGPAEPTEHAATHEQERASSSVPAPLDPVVPITPAEPPASADPGAPAAPTTPADGAIPTGPLIASATWAQSSYGATLKIAPTDSGRSATGPNAARTAWREVLEMAPDADTPGMWEQFDCHWTWARLVEPGKPTWNVEPWRPVVDEGRMVSERCNPGGPEV